MKTTALTHVQTRVEPDEGHILLVYIQRNVHKCLSTKHVALTISNGERGLEVLHRDGGCSIVRGLGLTGWEEQVIRDLCPGVRNNTATHHNYLVVTAHNVCVHVWVVVISHFRKAHMHLLI